MNVNPWPMNETVVGRPLARESAPPRGGDQDRDLGGRLNLSDGTPAGAVAIARP
jgi:hypothetical protein